MAMRMRSNQFDLDSGYFEQCISAWNADKRTKPARLVADVQSKPDTAKSQPIATQAPVATYTKQQSCDQVWSKPRQTIANGSSSTFITRRLEPRFLAATAVDCTELWA